MSKRIAYCAMLTALALVFSYVEVLIPINLGIPGIKLGLANLVIVVGLYLLKVKQVFVINIMRILLAGFMYGSGISIVYSLAGGLLSLVVMALLYKKADLSVIGVSIAGGVAHNIGQILMAILILQTPGIIAYLPVLLVAGLITGLLIGVVSDRIIHAFKKSGISL